MLTNVELKTRKAWNFYDFADIIRLRRRGQEITQGEHNRIPEAAPQPPKALNDHSIQPRCQHQHHHHHFACPIRQRLFIRAKKGFFLFNLARQTLLRRSLSLCDDKRRSKGVSLDISKNPRECSGASISQPAKRV